MKREKIKLYEEVHRIMEISNTDPVMGKQLISIDIQPEYENHIHFLPGFVDFINENHDSLFSLTFFYNGYMTQQMINEDDYKSWLYNIGIGWDVLNAANFYDKGYVSSELCMNKGVDEDDIINFVKFMIEKDINDSREMTEEFWEEYVERYGEEDVRELLEHADDCINIPDLIEELKKYDDIVLCGGGIQECFKEVEIALSVLDKPYGVLSRFIY